MFEGAAKSADVGVDETLCDDRVIATNALEQLCSAVHDTRTASQDLQQAELGDRGAERDPTPAGLHAIGVKAERAYLDEASGLGGSGRFAAQQRGDSGSSTLVLNGLVT